MKKGTVVILKEDLYNIDPDNLNSNSIITKTELDKRTGKYASKGDEFVWLGDDYGVFQGPDDQQTGLDASWYEITEEEMK